MFYLGYGTKKALGHIDIYVNGGKKQPSCKIGNTFIRTNGDVVKSKFISLIWRFNKHILTIKNI